MFVLIPRKQHVEDIGHYPDYYLQVKTFLSSHALEYVDLTNRFREKHLSSQDLYWEHDAHFNEIGNVVVGRILADWFFSHCQENHCGR